MGAALSFGVMSAVALISSRRRSADGLDGVRRRAATGMIPVISLFLQRRGMMKAWHTYGVSLARSRYSRGLRHRAPNPHLIDYARRQCRGHSSLAVLDIGCGAGRNAVPLALAGANVIGMDLSLPMLRAARERSGCSRLQLALARLHALPVRDRSIDLIIAHGIWNLARSGAEFRRAVAEAARAALPGAALFVFTFSRNSLARDARPIAGETFVFTQFSGQPQVFLTCEQLLFEFHTADSTPIPRGHSGSSTCRRPGGSRRRRTGDLRGGVSQDRRLIMAATLPPLKHYVLSI